MLFGKENDSMYNAYIFAIQTYVYWIMAHRNFNFFHNSIPHLMTTHRELLGEGFRMCFFFPL